MKKSWNISAYIPGVVAGDSGGGDAADGTCGNGGGDGDGGGGDGGGSTEGSEKEYTSNLISQLGVTNLPPCFPLQHCGI